MQFKRYLILTLSLLVLACGKESFNTPAASGPVTVGFVVGGADTRTTINDDGISTSWEKGDRIALWATSSDGSATLSEQEFSIYYRDGSLAMFTATLPPMAEGTYNYWATYPMPKTVNGTKATFNLPGTQDGSMSGGAAIMVAQPAQGPQLRKVTDIPKYSEIYDEHLSLKMKHATHALRFFAPSNKWGFNDGEKIERIKFTMPQGVAGDLTLDYTDPDAATTTANTSNTIVLNLTKPIGASASASAMEHACAAILPTAAFAAGDAISMKIYSKTQIVEQAISLAGRGAMQAGHITPVALDCSSPVEQPKIAFRIKTNNLGEQPYRITLTSKDTNTKWLITDDHIYEYYTGSATSTIADGKGFDIHYDEETLASISGQSVTVTYESESAIVTNAITMPAMTAGNNYSVELTVPYLFFEDFSTTTTSTSYNDNNKTNVSNAGNTDAKNLTSGYSWPSYPWTDNSNNIGIWSGARCGLDAGNSVRICSRSENAVGFPGAYYGRLDSPNMGNLKPNATVKLRIQFNYSLNRAGSKTSSHKHYLAIGTHTTAGLINASSGVGSWTSPGLTGVTINANVASGLSGDSGSFTNINNSVDKSISGCTQSTRFVWEVYIDKKSSDGYYNNWAYIDNIKVSITK